MSDEYDDLTPYEEQMFNEFAAKAKVVSLSIIEQSHAQGIPLPLLGMACDMASKGIQHVLTEEAKAEYGSMDAAIEETRKRIQTEAKAMEDKSNKIVDFALQKAARGLH